MAIKIFIIALTAIALIIAMTTFIIVTKQQKWLDDKHEEGKDKDELD